MEQKQLDEIDESYFGEEFVDETTEEKMTETTNQPTAEKAVSAKTKSSVGKKTKKNSAKEESSTEEVTITPVKSEKISQEEPKEKTEEVAAASKEEKQNDPWSTNEPESGFFKEISTWKAITGIVVILLIFSVFTNGFSFSETVSSSQGAVLPLSEAEQKALQYVNENLVQPPFLATVASSSDVGSFYKVTFSVAGQNVDSYITKDGMLFFPVGYNTSVSALEVAEVEPETIEVTPEQLEEGEQGNPVDEETQISEEETNASISSENSVTETAPPVQEPAPETAPEQTPVELSIMAKRWLFSPNELVVEEGAAVELLIEPEDLDFTFSIPSLDVEQEISGPTRVTFTASQPGTYQFTCSSCEEWRGMTGEIIVR